MAIVYQKTDCQCSDAFTGGEGHSRQIRLSRSESCFAEQLAVSQNQQTLHPQGRFSLQRTEKIGDLTGRNALLLRRNARQWLGAFSCWNYRLLHTHIKISFRGMFRVHETGEHLKGTVG